ncbi:hypothetical protein B0H34DRAFT_134590 [Crassisporium funariophilum]|nr:hypothetical protein B0H34DRAFT_134590 [Crassisporium funariophilum]
MGRTPHALLDNEDRIIAVLAGKPADPTWDAAVSNASAAMLHARITGKRNSAFNKDPESHRRGNFTAIPAGVSYGGGQTQPGNLVLPPKKREIVDKVLKHNDIKRIAGHQNSNLGFFFPLIYDDYRSHLRRLYEHSPNLRPNFPNISVYPACTLNLGPCTLTLDHTDPGNVAYGLCAITAMGNFEPKKGGHIILFDLKLVIEFPPGATVLIPSSVFRHGNTPIVGEGAWRMSLTQYCAGGLFRWVQYGFRTAKSLILSPGGKELKKEIDGKPADRAARALAMFSTLESLAKDRERVFGKRATQG